MNSTFPIASSSNSNPTPNYVQYNATTNPFSMINTGIERNDHYGNNVFISPITMGSARSTVTNNFSPQACSRQNTKTSAAANKSKKKGKQKCQESNKRTRFSPPNLKNMNMQKSQLRNSFEIPRIDLEINDEMLEDSYVKRKGLSLAYKDHGDQIYQCSKCNALLWEAEMLRGNSNGKKTVFGFCCKGGDVELPPVTKPPPLLQELYTAKNPMSNNFMKHIRAYIMMFSFTSMGGKINQGNLKGRGPYVFRLQGQNYHRMGSLLPAQGDQPKFSQLYIFDSENEAANREKVVSSGTQRTKKSELKRDTINILKMMLDSCSPLVKSFRMVRDCVKDNDWQDVSLKLITNRNKDGRVYNLPTTSEVAGLIIGDIDSVLDSRDITLRKQSGGLQRISELHHSYLALQCPLIFPFAEDGFRPGIKHRGIAQDSEKSRTKLTIREFHCYRMQDRPNEFSLLLHSKKLYHQYCVDGYTIVEADRLSYVKCIQKKLRTNTFNNLTTEVENGTTDASETGKRILLPSSFTGGSRYMMQKYLDAMAICKTVGYPDLFITITCNPNWPESYRCLVDKKLTAEDRPDIISRMFKIKLDEIINDFVEEEFFGPVQAGINVDFVCTYNSIGGKFG